MLLAFLLKFISWFYLPNLPVNSNKRQKAKDELTHKAKERNLNKKCIEDYKGKR